MTTAHTFLMFQGQCGAALDFYAAILPDTRILSLDRKPDGTVAMARLSIAGLEVMANDSPPVHDFDFTPSISIFLGVEDTDQVDALAVAMALEGKVLMPAGEYGFSRRFAWIQDRFGVSWQINVA